MFESEIRLTSSGQVHLISVPPYPSKPRLSHTFDLKHSANLRMSLPVPFNGTEQKANHQDRSNAYRGQRTDIA
jgi:hypothetical protein